jgi:alpha-galactosidase
VARITMIGAGSATFARMLLGDILSYPELRDVEVVLHDIDRERLETAEGVARVTAVEAGASPTLRAEPDLRAALDGADYVINMIAVGGHAATVADYEVPLRHGVRQTIGDTLGIGGIFRALRSIPVMTSIGDHMAEVCPNAWLLNYTNPMAMLCWATYRGSAHKQVVGLCHSVQNTTRQLAEYVGIPFEETTFVGAGVNHQAWILRFERDGENLYPLLDDLIARDPEMRRKVRVEMYRRFGYFPTESSEHSSEYLPWFLHHDEEIERTRLDVGYYVRESEENLEEYRRVREALAEGRTLEIEPSIEYAPQIIHSLETGQTRLVYGNVENTGLIENLPRGACVEVPCVVDRSGVHPVHVGELPPQCAALNRTFLNVAELTVRAALEGRRDHVLQAALLDPNTAATLTLDGIDRLVADMFDAHAGRLPVSLDGPGTKR